jgi:peptide-methionine (S)-S-oxide reductase
VGYAGGTTTAPTYHSLADHAEAIDLVFDKEVITFEQLLDLFWSRRTPTRAPSSQYRSALFCHDEAQLAIARASAEKQRTQLGHAIHTELTVGKYFYSAEDYHQKWRLRRHASLLRDLQRNYETEAALLASTAAAKLNAYVAGNGTAEQLDRDMDRLGLSDSGRRQLASLARHPHP